MTQSSCPRCGTVMGVSDDAETAPCPHCFADDGTMVALVARAGDDPARPAAPPGTGSLATSDSPPRAADQYWVEKGRLGIRVRIDPDSAYVLELFGDLDMDVSEVLAGELRQAELSAADRIVVDLSGLDFIDLGGLRILFDAHSSCSLRDPDRLVFLRGQGAVDRFLKQTGTEARLPFAD